MKKLPLFALGAAAGLRVAFESLLWRFLKFRFLRFNLVSNDRSLFFCTFLFLMTINCTECVKDLFGQA